MTRKYRIAIVGITGRVGREIFRILHEERDIASMVDSISGIASENSKGQSVGIGKHSIISQTLNDIDFSKHDIAFFSAGGEVSKAYAPIAAKAGCIVIDNTSYFRMHDDVPLIVPETNLHTLPQYAQLGTEYDLMHPYRNIIANPNCSTIQMICALKPLHDAAKIKRIVVSTYQSVSGAGNRGIDELYNNTRAFYEARAAHVDQEAKISKFTKNISFNCIPHIDSFLSDGDTKEEHKMRNETRKILEDTSIEISATCVRVPVTVGHSESVNIEFHNPISDQEATNILKDASGIMVYDLRNDGGYITPIECVKRDEVFVSRIRQDHSVQHGINMWVVADNLRKGAALNAIQIAEAIISQEPS